MPKLVIISKNVLSPGECRVGLTNGPYRESRPEQGFKVVGPATREEYVDCMVSYGGDREYEDMLSQFNGPWFFYEIQTD